ncbi:acyl carrier protein [Streptomyces sp. AC563]|uniref:acyl carrier protein n=1 Tax=Streptomyces buecherae TaxID=2763006 RepID=UPI00164D63AD|nr:acyl carrier protein [Streptomyces buecherae]MBC3988132.1 acyl carrier protein [Streptomyces buecherae]
MSQEEIFKALMSVFSEIVPEVDVSAATPQDSLRDLGANSIDRADIITETMEAAGVSLPMVRFADAKSIGDIVRVIDEARS